MKTLTKEQAIVITGFTGKLACQFSDFHGDVERRLGRSVFTHEFGNKKFAEEIQELYRQDFMTLMGEQ